MHGHFRKLTGSRLHRTAFCFCDSRQVVWAIVLRARAENDPIIISALRLFDATVIE